MRTERLHRRALRLALVAAVALCCFGSGVSSAPDATAADNPKYHLGYGPDSGKEAPTDWSGGAPVGIDKDNHYCLVDEIGDTDICRYAEAGELPGTSDICEGADGRGSHQADCSDADRMAFEKRALAKWRKSADRQAKNYDKLNKYITDCVDKGRTFKDCAHEGSEKYLAPAKTPVGWVKGKISEMASNALQEAANYIGKSVVWLLGEFAKVFASSSTIDLGTTGIGPVTGIMTSLSAVIAVFLLLLQFGKVSLSQRGEPAATAVAGLAKWAVISSVYIVATQTALGWADAVSDWIINFSFSGGGSGKNATEAMQHQLGTLFGGLITGGGGAATAGGALITGDGVAAAAVGVIIVVGIVCILAIGALWVEILLRQAGIMILVSTMPVVLAGQMSDATAEWWPKARNALVALILMKPMITVCFAIGFFAMSQGSGVQNMIVGLVIFLLACFAWPTLAKFMTFSTVGGGSSIASGLISSIGSSAGSASGGYRPEMGGAGAVGGGSGYTRALEQDTAQTTASGSNAGSGDGPSAGGSAKGAARFGGKVASTVGLGLQVMAAGKDTLESGMANTAAHAGLDHGGGGGRHVVIPPRGGSGSSRGGGQSGPPVESEPGPRAPAPASAPSNPPEA